MKTKHPHHETRVETRKSQLQQVVLPPHGHWMKVIAFVEKPEYTVLGIPMLNQLLGTTVARFGYFARYTAPAPRVEFQILTDRSMSTIKAMILGYRIMTARFIRVKFEKSNGSVPHALMFSIVANMQIRDSRASAHALMDVVHWGFNMAGFSYVQEAEALASHAAGCLHHIAGWQSEPIAGAPVLNGSKPPKRTPTK